MSRTKALQRLFQSVKLDSGNIMQQSICYNKRRFWSIIVSCGFVVQILRGMISPRELEMPTRTFLNWYKRAGYTAYAFNTRPVSKHPCEKPYTLYMSSSKYDRSRKQTVGVYASQRSRRPTCRWKMDSPDRIDSVVVFKKPDPNRWKKSLRRVCCRILPSRKASMMYMWVGTVRTVNLAKYKSHRDTIFRLLEDLNKEIEAKIRLHFCCCEQLLRLARFHFLCSEFRQRFFRLLQNR